MIITNGNVFTKDAVFEQLNVAIAGSVISDVSTAAASDAEVIDATDCYVIPGLTDIHFHGCVGYDFCDGTAEAISAIAKYQAANGITTICPATMTLSEDMLSGICATAADYVKETHDGEAALVGINLEGPFLSYAKRGAQNPEYLHKPDAAMLQRLQEKAGGLAKLVAIAPEEEGAMECIRDLKDDYVFSIAHTTANYEQAAAAFDAGACHVTHLYNAMPPLSHRDPGVIGAAFDKDAEVELICDGIHISPSVVRMTFQLFGDDSVILISDSMMATGMQDGTYALGGQPVIVKGNLATLESGTIAGSATNLMDCIRTAVTKMGIPLESAIKAATINPAKSIGIDDKYGSIETGKAADLVILNKDLSLKHVIMNGKVLK